MLNRRNFLKSASALTLGGLVVGKAETLQAATPVRTETTAKKSIGLQIYSLGDELTKDVPNGMKKIKKMGYSTLELAGYNKGKINGVDMMEFKKMAEDAGLKITSSHVNPPTGKYSAETRKEIMEFWKKTADDHAKLGVKYLVQPGQPRTRSVEEVAYVCDVFNEAGKIIKAAGIPFGYHNHDFEFAKVVPGGKEAAFGRHNKGEIIYDLFLKDTDPDLVFFEMDVYWTVIGQHDPVEYMKKYPDRIKLLHIKDRSVLGQSGFMNFEMIFKQARAIGVEEYYVELEGMPKDQSQFDGIKGCVDYLLKAPFVK